MRTISALGICLVVGAVLGAASAYAEEFDRSLELEAESLRLTNLIGEIQVHRHEGDGFRLEVHVRGEDADHDLIAIESHEGRRAAVDILFPLDDEHDYVYPRMGRSETTMTFREGRQGEGGWLRRFLGAVGGDRIRVRGSGSGLELWADVEVWVPEGGKLQVEHGVGNIEALDVEGDLTLDSRNGRVRAERIRGAVSADTGSGDVSLIDVTGTVHCDTGSGDVELTQVRGALVFVDTGSGSVDLRDVACEELEIDTGSGGVRGQAVSADDARIDTGSGNVSIEFARMGGGDFVIDTGSGGIDLLIPEDASAEIVAETGSGRIDVDVAGAEIRHRERDEVALEIGKGEARVQLDTGSGGITIAN